MLPVMRLFDNVMVMSTSKAKGFNVLIPSRTRLIGRRIAQAFLPMCGCCMLCVQSVVHGHVNFSCNSYWQLQYEITEFSRQDRRATVQYACMYCMVSSIAFKVT